MNTTTLGEILAKEVKRINKPMPSSILLAFLSIIYLVFFMFYFIIYFFFYESYLGFSVSNIFVLLVPLAFVTLVHVFTWRRMKQKFYKVILISMQLVGITIFAFNLTKPIELELKSSFSKERWSNFDGISDERFYMLDSLTKKIKGMTKKEIIELLGEPTDTDYFINNEKNLVYVLGPERGFFGIDYEWLIIQFNENGIMKDYSIASD